MKQEMSKKQRHFLQLVSCVGVLAACTQLLLVPGVQRLQTVLEERDVARKTQQDQSIAIMTIPAVAKEIQDNQKKQAELAGKYYDFGKPQRLDQVITGLALDQGMQPLRLEMKRPEPGTVKEYLPALPPEVQEERREEAKAQEQLWDELRMDDASKEQEEPQNSFLLIQRADFSAMGTEQQCMDFLNAAAQNPALHITDFQLQPRAAAKQEEESPLMTLSCRFQILMTMGQGK